MVSDPDFEGGCIELWMEPSCLRAVGAIRACPVKGAPKDEKQSSDVLHNVTLHRMVGPECRARSFVECSVPNGVGMQMCVFGWWGTTCHLSKCHAGHCATPASNGSVTCTPCSVPPKTAHREFPRCPNTMPFWCPNAGRCAPVLAGCGEERLGANSLCPLTKQLMCHGECHSDARACFPQPDDIAEQNWKIEEGLPIRHLIPTAPCGTKGHGAFICATGGCAHSHAECKQSPARIVPCAHKPLLYCARTRECVGLLQECYPLLKSCLGSNSTGPCGDTKNNCNPLWKQCLPHRSLPTQSPTHLPSKHESSRCPHRTPIECSDGTCARDHCASTHLPKHNISSDRSHAAHSSMTISNLFSDKNKQKHWIVDTLLLLVLGGVALVAVLIVKCCCKRPKVDDSERVNHDDTSFIAS